MPKNELLPYNCYTLHSLVKMLQEPRDSLSGHRPLLGHLLNPVPHTLTHSHPHSHWISFHFQKSRDELVWVTVVGKATIFLALCLHSAVDELLRQRSNKPIRKPSENVSKGQTHCFLENNIFHESKDCVYDPKHNYATYSYLFVLSPSTKRRGGWECWGRV